MKSKFEPFAPKDFSPLLEKLKSMPESYFPSDQDLRPSMRGYAEIHKMYRSACFDGRRGPKVKMACNPSDATSLSGLDRLANNFTSEQSAFAHRHGIPANGFSTCIVDRARVEDHGSSSYFLLAETLDSSLRPTLIGPGFVETYSKGPVATVARLLADDGKMAVQPLFTALAFREMASSLISTPLPELLKVPSPSFGFALICGAIEERLRRPSYGNRADYRSQFSANEEDDDTECWMPFSTGGGRSHILADFSLVSESIRAIHFIESQLCPSFSVICDFEGFKKRFEVMLTRNPRNGLVTANVFSHDSR